MFYLLVICCGVATVCSASRRTLSSRKFEVWYAVCVPTAREFSIFAVYFTNSRNQLVDRLKCQPEYASAALTAAETFRICTFLGVGPTCCARRRQRGIKFRLRAFFKACRACCGISVSGISNSRPWSIPESIYRCIRLLPVAQRALGLLNHKRFARPAS